MVDSVEVDIVVKLPPGESVVGMVVHKGAVIVATSMWVYRLVKGQLRPVMFHVKRGS